MSPLARKAFPLRLDPALHAAIERLAGAELRSVNAQIEFLLTEAVKRASRGALTEEPPPEEAEEEQAE